MRSRATRVALSAAALLVLAAAALSLIRFEQQIARRRAALREFDQQARAIVSELAVMRAAQQAYVTAGQGTAYWIPEVATLITKITGSIETLRQSASQPDTEQALTGAASSIWEFGDVDKRARDYLHGGEQLMAADVVFTEGGSTTMAAGHQVEAARSSEERAVDAFEARYRRFEAGVLGGAAGLTLLIIVLLVPAGAAGEQSAAAEAPAANATLNLAPPPAVEPAAPPADADALPRLAVPALKDAAALCTDLGRVRDAEELTALLGRAAAVMDARGVIVWLGAPGGPSLQPVLSSGYASELMSQMTPVMRSADNAAAAAYRTGRFQIVLARPGVSDGAVVAPLLSPDGCIGALTAEMKSGSETSDAAQALASIFAAQLSGVLASSLPATPAADEEPPAASRSAVG